MEVGTVLVIGGIVVVACAAGYFAYKKVSANSEDTTLSSIVNENANDQLVVDTLSGSDLTPWFKEKNADGKYENVILYPTEQNLQKFHISIPKGVKNNDDPLLLQLLLDSSKGNIVLMRSVTFEKMSQSLSDMLEKNDGCIFIK